MWLSFHARIQGVAWSPGGSFYAVAAANGDIAVWQTPNTLRWEKSLGTKIWSIAWSPDGAGQQRLAVACDDGKVRLLDALTGQQLLLYSGHGRASVLSLAWALDSILPATIASGDSDGTILLWDPTTGKTRATLHQAAPVKGLAFGGLWLISVGTQPGGTYIIWDAQAGQVGMKFTNDNQNTPYNNDNPNLVEGTLISVGWSSDNTFITVGDTNGNIQVLSDLNCSCYTYEKGFQAQHQPINSIAWAPDNKTFATASDDGTIQTWAAGTWKRLKIFTDPDKAKITSVTWAPDGKSLLAGDSSGHLHAWQVTG